MGAHCRYICFLRLDLRRSDPMALTIPLLMLLSDDFVGLENIAGGYGNPPAIISTPSSSLSSKRISKARHPEERICFGTKGLVCENLTTEEAEE